MGRRRKGINKPGRRAGRTLIRQLLLCFLILFIILTVKKVDIGIVNNTYHAIKTQFSKDAAIANIGETGRNVVAKLKDGTSTVVTSLILGRKGPEFTSPSDSPGSYSASANPESTGKTVEFHSEKELQVYAAAGGTVSEIDNDSDGNKYIKIYHGNDLYSLYGGCTSVYVQALEKVKKGQLIGSVAAGEEYRLRFEIWDKNRLADPADYITF